MPAAVVLLTISAVSCSGAATSMSSSGEVISTTSAGQVASAAVPVDCHPSPTSPPYQFGVLIRFNGGSAVVGPTTVSGISGSACAVATLVGGVAGCQVSGTVQSPPDGQLFDPAVGTLDLVPGQPIAVPIHIVPQPINGTFGCGSSTQGLVVTAGVTIEATTSVFGVTCLIGPAAATLNGTLGGPPYGGSSFTDIPGTLQGSLTVPMITPTATCPASVATNIDGLAGLPSTGAVQLPIVAALYQAGATQP